MKPASRRRNSRSGSLSYRSLLCFPTEGEILPHPINRNRPGPWLASPPPPTYKQLWWKQPLQLWQWVQPLENSPCFGHKSKTEPLFMTISCKHIFKICLCQRLMQELKSEFRKNKEAKMICVKKQDLLFFVILQTILLRDSLLIADWKCWRCKPMKLINLTVLQKWPAKTHSYLTQRSWAQGAFLLFSERCDISHSPLACFWLNRSHLHKDGDASLSTSWGLRCFPHTSVSGCKILLRSVPVLFAMCLRENQAILWTR